MDGATRLRIPAEGTADDLFDLAIGADNLLHTDRTKLRVRFSVINLTRRRSTISCRPSAGRIS
jgi:hypothetical protein